MQEDKPGQTEHFADDAPPDEARGRAGQGDAAPQAESRRAPSREVESEEDAFQAEPADEVAASEDEQGPEPAGADAADPERLADGLTIVEVVEALLFATDSPLPANRIAQILQRGTSRHVRAAIKRLNARYERVGAAFRIEEVAGGCQMLTLPRYQPWLVLLQRTRHDAKLTPAQMETLAIIAYKQPVLRADVEAVRGVDCSDVISRLREVGLVKIVGRAEDVGRPLLYGTTRKFLRVFGLGDLNDLPRVEELRPPGATASSVPRTQGEPAGSEGAGKPPPQAPPAIADAPGEPPAPNDSDEAE